MEKVKICSFDTLCPEVSVKAVGQKVKSSSQYVNIASSNQCSSKTKGLYFNLDEIPFNPNLDPEPGSCFNCWGQGHSHHECPKPKRQDFCNNCGRLDVRVNICPRCSRSYMEQNENDDEELEYLVKSISSDEVKYECLSSTESGYHEEVVVDEGKRSLEFTGVFVEDFLNLMDAMKHLPIQTQNTVILRFVEDRRKLMTEGGLVKLKISYLDKIWEFCRSLFNFIYQFGRKFVSSFI